MKGIKLLTSLTLVLMLILVLVYINTDNPESIVIEVTTQQFKFTPNIINVTYDTTITLRITSIDVTHGFQLEEYKLFNIVIPAGETSDITFKTNKRGTFRFYCTVLCGAGHSDHLGTLVVE